MSLMEIALRTGIPLADIEALVQGNAPESVATALGVPLLGLEDFIVRGAASSKMAHRLGTSMAAAEELAQAVGAQGAVGIVLGLLLSSGRASRKSSAASG